MKEYEIKFDKSGNPIKPVKIGIIGIPDWIPGVVIIIIVILILFLR